MMEQTSEISLGIMLLRQLIRAEKIRQQCFYEARLPEFIGEATPALKASLQALIALGEKNPQQALHMLQQAELSRSLIVGCYNEKMFTGMRDGDDFFAGLLELFTKDGKYYWIALEQINTLEFYKPERPIDLLWRRAHLSIHGGPEGEVYIPAIYIQTPVEHESARLGYTTDWCIEQDQPVQGIGQRSFLIGEELVPIMEIKSLVIQA